MAAGCTETALLQVQIPSGFSFPRKLRGFSGFYYLFVWDLLFSWVWGGFF